MAVTAQQVLDSIQFDIFEDTGLRLGILTENQYLDLLNLTLIDFFKQTGILQRVYTQTVSAGIGQYDIPDDIMEIESVWLAGRYLPKWTQRELANNVRNWRRELGMPRCYYTDGLPLKTLALGPAPNYTGAYIIGPNEPDPPHAVYDSFAALCQIGTTQVVLNAVQHRGLTVVGTQKSTTSVTALTDPIPLIPDDFILAYIGFGILERVFLGDNELHDTQSGMFCKAQYQEGINALRAITGEPAIVEQA